VVLGIDEQESPNVSRDYFGPRCKRRVDFGGCFSPRRLANATTAAASHCVSVKLCSDDATSNSLDSKQQVRVGQLGMHSDRFIWTQATFRRRRPTGVAKVHTQKLRTGTTTVRYAKFIGVPTILQWRGFTWWGA